MSENENRFRAVGYCRVSSADQVTGTLTIRGSLEEQEAKARTYAEQQGWEFNRVYVEPGISGEKFDERKALQEMLEDARAGQFDCVIVRAGDRLARDQEVFFRITKILNQFYNIQILNLANPSQIVEPSSFVGRRNPMLIVQQGFDAMMGAFDQARRIDMLMEGKKRQVRAGRFINSQVFYGYGLDHRVIAGRKVDRVPVPDPKEYWVLQLLPKLMLEENLSDREIALWLTELGAPSREGGPWRKTTVARLLTQPFYAGKIAYGRQVTKIDAAGKAHPVKNLRTESIILASHKYEHPWDWETFERMQDRRRARHSSPPKQTVSRSPVAGILICGYCGHTMVMRLGGPRGQVNRWVTFADGSRHYRPYQSKTARPDYFVCGYHNITPGACQVNRVPVKMVMDRLVFILKELAHSKEADPEGFYANLKTADQTTRREALTSRLNGIKAELVETIPAKVDRLNRGYLNGMVSEEQYPVLTKIINEERDLLAANLLNVENELRRLDTESQKADKMRSFMDDLNAMVERLQQPVGNWPDGDARKVLQWLSSRYEKIAVSLENTPQGRTLNFNIELKSL